MVATRRRTFAPPDSEKGSREKSGAKVVPQTSTSPSLLKEFLAPRSKGGGDAALPINWECWKPLVPELGAILTSPCVSTSVSNLKADVYQSHSYRKRHMDEGHAQDQGSDQDSLEELLMNTLDDGTSPMDVETSSHHNDATEDIYTLRDSKSKDQSIYLALQSIGFSSWSHFIDTIAHETATTRSSRRNKRKAKVTLKDVLNGTSPYYHARFARSYQNIRKNLRQKAIEVHNVEQLQQHSTLTTSWSSLTAEEHSWYLLHQHRTLYGRDEKRFKSLNARVEKEREMYLNELHAHACVHKSKYDHLTARQAAQLQSDDDRRRERISTIFPPPTMSILYPIDSREPIESSDRFEYVSVLHTSGTPPEMSQLEDGHILPGDKHYLPAIKSLNSSHSVYRKESTGEIHEDPKVRELLQQLLDAHDDSTQKPPLVIVATAGVFQALITLDLMKFKEDIDSFIEIPTSFECSDVWPTKVCYLHKPLMPKAMTTREKQRRVQKYAVLTECSTRHSLKACERQTVYSLWKQSSTGILCIVRSHSMVMCSGKPSVIAIKPEYLPEPDREETTSREIANWKARLCLGYPAGARHLQVAHVSIPRGRILSWSTMQLETVDVSHPIMASDDVKVHGGTTVSFRSNALASCLTWATRDQWSLARVSLRDKTWTLYQTSKTDDVPYDIIVSHQTSTTTDVVTSSWVAPIWRPYNASVAQIPYTFPPHCPDKGATAKKKIPPKKRTRHDHWNGDLDRAEATHVSLEGLYDQL